MHRQCKCNSTYCNTQRVYLYNHIDVKGYSNKLPSIYFPFVLKYFIYIILVTNSITTFVVPPSTMTIDYFVLTLATILCIPY